MPNELYHSQVPYFDTIFRIEFPYSSVLYSSTVKRRSLEVKFHDKTISPSFEVAENSVI